MLNIKIKSSICGVLLLMLVTASQAQNKVVVVPFFGGEAPEPEPEPEPKKLFITDNEYDGDLGGEI